MEKELRCDVCNKVMPLNLYIEHRHVCAMCEGRMAKNLIGVRTHKELMRYFNLMIDKSQMTLN